MGKVRVRSMGNVVCLWKIEMQGHVCVCVCASPPDAAPGQRGVRSTSTNWILPKHDSDEVLFRAAVIVSIFTPVCEYYSGPARCTRWDPAPASSSINDSAEKSNSYMMHIPVR